MERRRDRRKEEGRRMGIQGKGKRSGGKERGYRIDGGRKARGTSSVPIG